MLKYDPKTGKPVKIEKVPRYNNCIPVDNGGGTNGLKLAPGFELKDGVYEYR